MIFNLATPWGRFRHSVWLGRYLRKMQTIMVLSGRGGRLQPTKRLPFESKRDRRNKQALNDDFARMVHRMWNRECNAWARAGYPGLMDRDIAKLRPYFLGARFEWFTR